VSQIIPFPRRKKAPKESAQPQLYAALIPIAALLGLGLASWLIHLSRRRFR